MGNLSPVVIPKKGGFSVNIYTKLSVITQNVAKMTDDQLDAMLLEISKICGEMGVPVTAMVQASVHHEYKNPENMRGNLQLAIGAMDNLASRLSKLARYIESLI